MTEYKLFFQRWLQEPRRLGTLAPISKRLAFHAARCLRHPASVKVMELGAGTGRLTRALLGAGVKSENLTLVELDKDLADYLKKQFPRLTVLEGDATRLVSLVSEAQASGGEKSESPNDHKMDAIFSVIPLMYLSPETRYQIFEQASYLLKPGGKFYHVGYTPFSPLRENATVLSHRLLSLWMNLPPGFVWEFNHA